MLATVPSLFESNFNTLWFVPEKNWTKQLLFKNVCGYHFLPRSHSTARIGTKTEGLGQSAIFSLVRSSSFSERWLFKRPECSIHSGCKQVKTSRQKNVHLVENVQPHFPEAECFGHLLTGGIPLRITNSPPSGRILNRRVASFPCFSLRVDQFKQVSDSLKKYVFRMWLPNQSATPQIDPPIKTNVSNVQ